MESCGLHAAHPNPGIVCLFPWQKNRARVCAPEVRTVTCAQHRCAAQLLGGAGRGLAPPKAWGKACACVRVGTAGWSSGQPLHASVCRPPGAPGRTTATGGGRSWLRNCSRAHGSWRCASCLGAWALPW